MYAIMFYLFYPDRVLKDVEGITVECLAIQRKYVIEKINKLFECDVSTLVRLLV